MSGYLTSRVPSGKLSCYLYRPRFRNDLRVQARLFPGVIELHSGVTPGVGLPIRHTAEKPSKSIVRSTDESMCNSQSPRHAAPISGSDKSRQTFMLSDSDSPTDALLYRLRSVNQPVTARCSYVGLVHPPGSSTHAAHIRAYAHPPRAQNLTVPIFSISMCSVPPAETRQAA